jgi:hypothetical protein
MEARQMNPPIEKVARAMEDVGSMSSYASKGLLREARARAAIRATLEHLRDNISEGVSEQAYTEANAWVNDCAKFDDILRAAFSQAIAELDA